MKINVKSDVRGWNVGDVIEQIFEDRKIDDPYHFLNPRKEDMLPLTDLKNIDEAAQIVLSAVADEKKICINVDGDTDGSTSGAIIYRYLKHLGANPTPFINKGKGHGLQEYNLDQYKEFNLLIIVDSLDANAKLYEKVQQDSEITDIVVLDHHTINPQIPYDRWITLVSSQRDYGNPELSGAGVTWKFCKYLDFLLGIDFADTLVDLATTGIQADMMDITVPENRYICNEGFKKVINPALSKIVGGFGWNSKSVAFSVAPLVNASMRLSQNEYAMDLFLQDDNAKISSDLKVLNKCKEDQNAEVARMMDDVTRQCDIQLEKKMLVIFIDTQNGLAGLVGNHILNKYKRPIVILNKNLDGDCYKGSMRAVGVDDFQSMVNDSGLAKAYGHALAAGIVIKQSNLEAFKAYMERVLPDVGAYEETIDADVWVHASDIDEYFVDDIQRLNKISGTGFPEIRIYIDGITDYEIGSMSQGKHLVITLADSKLTLIQWNFDGDWDYFEEAAMMGEELEAVVSVQSGWIGRKFMVQGIISYIGVKG